MDQLDQAADGYCLHWQRQQSQHASMKIPEVLVLILLWIGFDP